MAPHLIHFYIWLNHADWFWENVHVRHQRMQHKYRKGSSIVCLSESLGAAELASHFSSLQKISYLILALFSQTKGIQQRDLHNGFLLCCRLCLNRAGKNGKFDPDSHTHTDGGRCPCCMSHFQTKGECGGPKWKEMPVNAVKRRQKKWVGHFPAQSRASHCFQCDTQ